MSLIFPDNINLGIYSHHMKTKAEKKKTATEAYSGQEWETGYDAIPPADRALFWIDGLLDSIHPTTERIVMIKNCPLGDPVSITFQQQYHLAQMGTSIGLELCLNQNTKRANRFFCVARSDIDIVTFQRKIFEGYPQIFKGPGDVDWRLVKIEKGIALVELCGPAIDAIRHAEAPPEPVFIPMDITIGD